MSETRALVAHSAMADDSGFRSDHLKLCYLWYDEVLFDTIGRFDEDAFFAKLVGDVPARDRRDITDVLVPLSHRLIPEVTGTVLDRLPMGYPRWGEDEENYDYPEPENAFEFAHNALLRRIEAEKGVTRFEGYDTEQAEGRARVAVDTVCLWERVNDVLPCMLQAQADEQAAMSAARAFGKEPSGAPTAAELFGAVIPSLTAVGWNEIADFKRRGGFSSLRRKIEEAYAVTTGDLEKAKAVFAGFEDATSNEIIERFRPRVRKVAIEALLANIPGIPLVNPFGLYFGGRDAMKELGKRKQLDWFYLLRDIRKVSERSPE